MARAAEAAELQGHCSPKNCSFKATFTPLLLQCAGNVTISTCNGAVLSWHVLSDIYHSLDPLDYIVSLNVSC